MPESRNTANRQRLAATPKPRTNVRHHLVILRDEYLELMIAGRKRIECRLSAVRRPPFEAVSPGDLLWLKLPSRPIHAVATAGQCEFHALGAGTSLNTLLSKWSAQICAAEGFFEGASAWAKFASLIWIETVVVIRPMPVYKSDQRAWVVLDQMPSPQMRIGRQREITTRP